LAWAFLHRQFFPRAASYGGWRRRALLCHRAAAGEKRYLLLRGTGGCRSGRRGDTRVLPTCRPLCLLYLAHMHGASIFILPLLTFHSACSASLVCCALGHKRRPGGRCGGMVSASKTAITFLAVARCSGLYRLPLAFCDTTNLPCISLLLCSRWLVLPGAWFADVRDGRAAGLLAAADAGCWLFGLRFLPRKRHCVSGERAACCCVGFLQPALLPSRHCSPSLPTASPMGCPSLRASHLSGSCLFGLFCSSDATVFRLLLPSSFLPCRTRCVLLRCCVSACLWAAVCVLRTVISAVVLRAGAHMTSFSTGFTACLPSPRRPGSFLP